MLGKRYEVKMSSRCKLHGIILRMLGMKYCLLAFKVWDVIKIVNMCVGGEV